MAILRDRHFLLLQGDVPCITDKMRGSFHDISGTVAGQSGSR